jgi:hypothetical protein
MKLKKLFLSVLSLFLILTAVKAREAVYTGDRYTISLIYNDSAFPGDAVFVRMRLSAPKGYKKSKTAAVLELRNKKKKIDSTDFFSIKNGINGVELLAGIPLSSLLEAEEYTLVITYSFSGSSPMEFTLPFIIKPKEFIQKTIPVGDKTVNTKNGSSSSRIEQAEKLSSILHTANAADIFQASKFSSPVTARRRIAEFAERIRYTYSGGGSCTKLQQGIDYAIPAGTTVSACADGKVVFAEKQTSTGLNVVIEHLPGLFSFYYHLDALSIKEGQIVKEGDKIGLTEAGESVFSSAFRWEICLNTVPVNPDFFTQDFAFDDKKK